MRLQKYVVAVATVTVVGAAALGCSDDKSGSAPPAASGDAAVSASLNNNEVVFTGGSRTCTTMEGSVVVAAGDISSSAAPSMSALLEPQSLRVTSVAFNNVDGKSYSSTAVSAGQSAQATATKTGSKIVITGTVGPVFTTAGPQVPFTITATCPGLAAG